MKDPKSGDFGYDVIHGFHDEECLMALSGRLISAGVAKSVRSPERGRNGILRSSCFPPFGDGGYVVLCSTALFLVKAFREPTDLRRYVKEP